MYEYTVTLSTPGRAVVLVTVLVDVITIVSNIAAG